MFHQMGKSVTCVCFRNKGANILVASNELSTSLRAGDLGLEPMEAVLRELSISEEPLFYPAHPPQPALVYLSVDHNIGPQNAMQLFALASGAIVHDCLWPFGCSRKLTRAPSFSGIPVETPSQGIIFLHQKLPI